MFMSGSDYKGWKNGQCSRKFYFTDPITTTKIRMDNLKGATVTVFKVEFFGLDRSKRNLHFDALNGIFLTSSKSSSCL